MSAKLQSGGPPCADSLWTTWSWKVSTESSVLGVLCPDSLPHTIWKLRDLGCWQLQHLTLCGPCSSPCKNCWSYLVHPSFSLVGEWNLDPLDWSWPEEGICLHYVTKSELHPLVLTSSPLWSFFPGWGAPGIPPGGTMALTLLTDDITVILGDGVAGSGWHR